MASFNLPLSFKERAGVRMGKWKGPLAEKHRRSGKDCIMTRVTTALLLATLMLAASLPASGFDGVETAQIRKLAEAGNADAQSKLGVLYAQGMGGFPRDKKEAASWYRRSADQGDPLGQWNLAFLYVKGEGVEADYAKARGLFRKAAETGFVNAQYDLGMMLLEGLGGDQDRQEAEQWFHRAADQEYKEAVQILKELNPEQGLQKDIQEQKDI
jgi:uncharacterized protein